MHYNKKREARLKSVSGDNYKTHDFDPRLLRPEIDPNLILDLKRGEDFYKERQKNIDIKYQEWLSDERHLTFKSKPIVPDSVVIEVFFYDESTVTSSTIIMEDLSGNKISYYKVCPVAKVLTSNTVLLNPGDIVKLPAVIGKTVRSNEWIEWKKAVKSQPSLVEEYPEPPATVGKLNEWSNYIYQEDPLGDITIKDQHTFCLPYRMLLTVEQ